MNIYFIVDTSFQENWNKVQEYMDAGIIVEKNIGDCIRTKTGLTVIKVTKHYSANPHLLPEEFSQWDRYSYSEIFPQLMQWHNNDQLIDLTGE
jgi:hypothetical protein